MSRAAGPLSGSPAHSDHVHCDSDPIECSVEALQGEYGEVKTQRDRFRSALEAVYSLPAQSVITRDIIERALRPEATT